jgi:hypothetical protein
MYICSNCNIELSKEDLEACELVAVGKLYCQDCLLNVEKHLFVDNKGLLNHTWDIYEKFLLKKLKESWEEPDFLFTETDEECMKRYEK